MCDTDSACFWNSHCTPATDPCWTHVRRTPYNTFPPSPPCACPGLNSPRLPLPPPFPAHSQHFDESTCLTTDSQDPLAKCSYDQGGNHCYSGSSPCYAYNNDQAGCEGYGGCSFYEGCNRQGPPGPSCGPDESLGRECYLSYDPCEGRSLSTCSSLELDGGLLCMWEDGQNGCYINWNQCRGEGDATCTTLTNTTGHQACTLSEPHCRRNQGGHAFLWRLVREFPLG